MALEEYILEICFETGCTAAGIAGAQPFLQERKNLLKRQRNGPDLPFAGGDIFTRTEPSMVLPGVKSIISLGYSYALPLSLSKPKDEPRGSWSRFARLQDYHNVMGAKLSRISACIKDYNPGINLRYYVDTGPLLDRAAAYRAGLGFWGKNNCLIHRDKGSFIFLGEILLDLQLNPTSPTPPEDGCRDCRNCVNACPTGALTPYSLDPGICLSSVSQSGEYIPPYIRSLLGDRLYGCDLCQEACPYNGEGSGEGPDRDFLPIREPYPLLLPLLALNKREFAARFQTSPLFWRGRTILQRNAIIALGNLKAVEAGGELGRLLLEDPRPPIRGYSAWALGEMKESRGFQLLAKALEKERDTFVLQEISGALSRFQKS